MTQDREQQQECQETLPSQICCCAKKCCMALMGLISLVWIALSVAEIVVGSVYLNSCNPQRYIPIYLIVNGVTVIIISLLSFVAGLKPNKVIYALLGLLSLFWLAWLIAGSVWTFPLYPGYAPCNAGLYLFTFSILIIQWILLALSLPALFAKLFCLCSSCESCATCTLCSSCCSCCSFMTKY